MEQLKINSNLRFSLQIFLFSSRCDSETCATTAAQKQEPCLSDIETKIKESMEETRWK